MIKYRFTYDITTPESAEIGEYAECGWYSPPGCAGGRFQGSGEGNDAYHEDRASQAVRNILGTIGGYGDMQQTHDGRAVVYGCHYTDPYTCAEERRSVEIVAPSRLLRAVLRKIGSRA
jgi:hypothetical protein